MKFIDEALVRVASGKGGDGCMSFRRERYIEMGGPDGGNGGKGGDVVFVATTRRNTLLDVRGHALFRAGNGHAGGGKGCTGARGEPIEIEVPVGTRFLDEATGLQVCDLVEDGQRWVAAEGGHPGRGNMTFKTSTNRAPRQTTPGGPSVERTLQLELMLLADVGLLGFPNAGKSTLIRRISAARPRVADYPFTTLVPNLGVVDMGDDGSFVVADVPGLIRGAAEGAGLGHQFLRHLKRTRVLLHLISVAEHDGDDPVDRYLAIREELQAYDAELASRAELLVLTKIDAVSEERLAEVTDALRTATDSPLLAISAVAGRGLDELVHAAWARVRPER